MNWRKRLDTWTAKHKLFSFIITAEGDHFSIFVTGDGYGSTSTTADTLEDAKRIAIDCAKGELPASYRDTYFEGAV